MRIEGKRNDNRFTAQRKYRSLNKHRSNETNMFQRMNTKGALKQFEGDNWTWKRIIKAIGFINVFFYTFSSIQTIYDSC